MARMEGGVRLTPDGERSSVCALRAARMRLASVINREKEAKAREYREAVTGRKEHRRLVDPKEWIARHPNGVVVDGQRLMLEKRTSRQVFWDRVLDHYVVAEHLLLRDRVWLADMLVSKKFWAWFSSFAFAVFAWFMGWMGALWKLATGA